MPRQRDKRGVAFGMSPKPRHPEPPAPRVAGERDPKVLVRYRHSRVKANAQEITKALTGNWREEHLFVLGQALAMYDDIGKHLEVCDAKLQTLLAERAECRVDLGKAPRAGAKSRVEFDDPGRVREHLVVSPLTAASAAA